MTLLHIQRLLKTEGNATLIPKFDLQIDQGQCVAIQCRQEVGNVLLRLLIGLTPPSGGCVLFKGNNVTENKQSLIEKVGIFLLDDNVYERLNAEQYLTYFSRLYGTHTSVDTVIQQVGLWDKVHTPSSRLTFSEKRRLHIGRCMIHRPELVIMEEPEQNVDMESRGIIRHVIEQLIADGTAVILTTSVLEDAVSITDQVYQLNENGLKKIEASDEGNIRPTGTDEDDLTNDDVAPGVQQPIRIEKVPAKVSDKMILFDPIEIDYVESMEGTSHLHVKGESFPCTLTLSDLEQKLKPFGFYRCHRSYVVNLQRVREVIKWTRSSYSLSLDDKQKSTIPLSKGSLEELKHILGL